MFTPLKLYIYLVQLRGQGTDMKNVSISEFRANLLKYLRQVKHGEQINVTSKGDLLATLTPPISQQNAARTKLRELAKTAVLHDVLSPIDENWDAMK